MISELRSASGLFTSWRNGYGGSDAADAHDHSSHVETMRVLATQHHVASQELLGQEASSWHSSRSPLLNRRGSWSGLVTDIQFDDDAIENG